MNTMITAIYENGILRPLLPLPLPEHTRVRVQIEPLSASTTASEHRRRVSEALTAAGLSLPGAASQPPTPPLTDERRAELARRFAIGGPLSEIILTEREEHE